MDRKMVDFIKEQYPPGTRIRLNAMDDPYAPILPGTEGEVDFVDDAGQLHMKWDNGRSLALIPGEDSFTVLPPKLTSLKLYIHTAGRSTATLPAAGSPSSRCWSGCGRIRNWTWCICVSTTMTRAMTPATV